MSDDEGLFRKVPRRLRVGHRVVSSWFANAVAARDAVPGRRQLIVGRAEAYDGHLLESPFTQTRAVFWQAEAEKYQSGVLDRGGWASVLREHSTATFWIVDDTGERTRIDPGVAVARLELVEVTGVVNVGEAGPALRRFLEEHIVQRRRISLEGTFAFYERLVAPGDTIGVYGKVSRERAVGRDAGAAGYRDPIALSSLIAGDDREPLVILRR